MKLIIPMAGRGSRLRPHTLTIPKPLVPIAGKPIVQRLVEDLVGSAAHDFDEIAFIIGDFGSEAESTLMDIAGNAGAKGHIFYQDEPLGTAHAILCAKEKLNGPVIVAFADTLFQADFTFDESKDGYIWVREVEDPSAFGVVKTNAEGFITDFIEKPAEPVSNLAIVGIYYFRDGENLRAELQHLIDHDIREKGEYQLTNALENMKQKGKKFYPRTIQEWLDCGNKEAFIYANQRMLAIKSEEDMVAASARIEDSLVIQPCFIGENVQLKHSVIGPYVSLGRNSVVENAVIENSVIQRDSLISGVVLRDSMIGNEAEVISEPKNLSIGDFSKQQI